MFLQSAVKFLMCKSWNVKAFSLTVIDEFLVAEFSFGLCRLAGDCKVVGLTSLASLILVRDFEGAKSSSSSSSWLDPQLRRGILDVGKLGGKERMLAEGGW